MVIPFGIVVAMVGWREVLTDPFTWVTAAWVVLLARTDNSTFDWDGRHTDRERR